MGFALEGAVSFALVTVVVIGIVLVATSAGLNAGICGGLKKNGGIGGGGNIGGTNKDGGGGIFGSGMCPGSKLKKLLLSSGRAPGKPGTGSYTSALGFTMPVPSLP